MRKRGEESADGRQIEGRYANYFEIGHNAHEFVFDFGQIYSNYAGMLFHTRIVTAPQYAKEFMEALQNNILKHEKEFGYINNTYEDQSNKNS